MPHLHRLAGVFILCAVAIGLLAPDSRPTGPARESIRPAPAAQQRPPAGQRPAKPAADQPPSPTSQPPKAPPTAQQIAAAKAAKANELGMVPVFMYHRIVKKTDRSLDRTLDEFRDELTRLAEEGYVPVTAAEYASGQINIPAGRHPVVLTFDDADPTQLAFDPSGAPRGDTAVGVLLEVARSHPGFRPVATMYVGKDLFQMADKAAGGLRWLIQHGFEVANHTYNHKALSTLSKDGVREEIGHIQKVIHDLGGIDATTLAYPEGVEPRKHSWAASGDAEGVKWDFTGMFLAGWMPASSPFHEDFDLNKIPRVRSEGKIKEDDCKQYCSTAWLDYLKKHPDERYTSDGIPGRIAFPESERDQLPKKLADSGLAY